MIRSTRLVAGAAAIAIAVAGCGGGEDAPSATVESTEGIGTPDGGSGVGATVSVLGLSADDPTVVRSGELAVVLVGNLGSDDAAAGALLLAGDAGYDGLQIEAAVVADTLAADGTIAGAEPVLAAYGRIEGLRSAQEEPLPIDDLRREARETGGREDLFPEGALATTLILQWQLSGYSQEQIVEMLILGVEQLDAGYEGEIAVGEEVCGGYVIGGVHEIPDFCDDKTGELYAYDEPAPSDEPVPEPADADGLCGGDFAPPYGGVPIEGAGVLLETEILGPLETPYYYSEVSGLLDIAADGKFDLNAKTVRLGDITIRDAPDNQVYTREFTLSGSIDFATGDGEITGMVSGTDVLFTGDRERAVGPVDVSGQIAVVCDDAEAGGFAIFGFASGNGALEFEARP